MSEIISKELLSEVLNDKTIGNVLTDAKTIEHKIFGDIKENEIAYYSAKNGWQIINIYELEHKSKEWAFNSGYEIVQLSKSVKIYRNGIEVFYLFSKIDDKEIYCMDMIFKCYQWILDNKDNK